VSLLWRDAAQHQVQAAWWNTDHDERDEDAGRTGESMPDRRKRCVSMIVDRHNVSRTAAAKALRNTFEAVSSDSAYHNIDHFDPEGHLDTIHHGHDDYYSHHESRVLHDPGTWEGRKVEQVPIDGGLHATQDWVRPSSMAHNLFHPGKKESNIDDEIGDPDFDPDNTSESEDDYEGEESPEHRALGNVPKFVRRHDGSHEIVDGHHRVMTDVLLGKKHTPGHVLDEGDLDSLARGKNPVDEAAKTRDHLIGSHGYSHSILHDSSPADLRETHEQEHDPQMNTGSQPDHDHWE
jgi:hypothetical protein